MSFELVNFMISSENVPVSNIVGYGRYCCEIIQVNEKAYSEFIVLAISIFFLYYQQPGSY